MEVPLARGVATCTTIWTEPEAPAARLPTDQVTAPLARVPPAGAGTKVGLAGTGSGVTTPGALAARLPGDQVTTPLARVPPAEAETKVVLAGTASVITTPVALALPVLE